MLQCGEWEKTKSYFKFENWWLHTEGFPERIRDWWNSFCFKGKPSFVLMAKLKALKDKIKEWSKSAQGNLATQKQLVLSQLANFELIQEQRNLGTEEIASRVALGMEFEDIAKREEIAWRQRSRATWLKQGDRNTATHRRVNTISKLKVREVEIADQEEIQKEIISFYEDLYDEPESWRPGLEMNNCPRLQEEDNSLLQAPFEQQEILNSINSCAEDKAPGPDGFTMAFYRHCWDIIKVDLTEAIQHFHKSENFERSINATFIALIPKKAGVMELSDFRPISLIGGVYKIIAKMLAERMKRVIHKLVDRQQMAFIKGRQIMDAVVIANECVESKQRSKIPGLLCKLDIQKAYDHLN